MIAYRYDSTDINDREAVVVYLVPAGTEVQCEADASDNAVHVEWEV